MMKQVIVMRTDLNMRKGKMIAQGAHASLRAYLLTDDVPEHQIYALSWRMQFHETKICVGVDSFESLSDIYHKAILNKLPAAIVLDAGKTEFKEPTYTCVCIGPAPAEEIDKITGDLKLL